MSKKIELLIKQLQAEWEESRNISGPEYWGVREKIQQRWWNLGGATEGYDIRNLKHKK
jgi:hypothetical protein